MYIGVLYIVAKKIIEDKFILNYYICQIPLLYGKKKCYQLPA